MQILYNLSIQFYHFAIQLAAFFGKQKARLWLIGRKNWRARLKEEVSAKSKVIWFHAASMGEFEQARPLIERIKEGHAEYTIVLSFFSPSGFEVHKNYDKADVICYLPLDTRKNAKDFIDLINPEIAVFVKYEFWFNFLNTLKDRQIKTYLISGIFRSNQHFFKAYGGWFREGLRAISHFYIQNEDSKQLLNHIDFTNITLAGDSRSDRVLDLSRQSFKDFRLDSFCADRKVIIFGSSWAKEEGFALQLSTEKPQVKTIIVPHELKPERMIKLRNSIEGKAVLLSKTKEDQDLSDFNVLIIDKMGWLSKVYRYGQLAVIGGGFGAGIHNTLEAAVYGCPVLFGPNFHKFQEAKDLIDRGGGFVVIDYEAFKTEVEKLIDNSEYYEQSSTAAKQYVEEITGASDLIYGDLFSI